MAPQTFVLPPNREIGNGLGLSEALHHRGDIATAQSDHEAANRYYTEGQQLKAQLSHP